MPLDIVREMVNNRFLIILMEERMYLQKLEDMLKSIGGSKICYVCLSKPYSDVVSDLNERGIKTSNFIFIDVLSSHYKNPKPSKNCIFIRGPTELTKIRLAIKKAIEERKCSVIIFDTISTLLIYQETSSIVRFTHHLLSEKEHENVKKLFIVLKGDQISSDENIRLVEDLSMFADKTLDLSKNINNKSK